MAQSGTLLGLRVNPCTIRQKESVSVCPTQSTAPRGHPADCPGDLIQKLIFSKRVTHPLQLCVLRLGLLKEGNVWIGVFPEREEILVRGATLGDVALEGVGTTQLEMRQCTDGFVEHDPAMVNNFLELGCGLFALVRQQVRL